MFAPKGSVSSVPGSSDYRRIQRRVTALVAPLSASDAALMVAATPEWSIHDLLAHMCGTASDVVNGRLDGVTTDPWTDAQVTERSDRSTEEIVAEWNGVLPALCDLIDAMGDAVDPRLFIDLWTHEQDLRGAIGTPGGIDDPIVAGFAPTIATGFEKRAAKAGLDPLRVEVMGLAADAPRPAVRPTASVRVGAFDLMRGLTGRRSRRQIGDWEWDGATDTDAYAEALCVFTVARRDIADAR